MPRVDWDDSLSVGIELIDEQHKVWIERLNSLSAAVESHQEVHHVSKTLDFMVDYVEFHFATEERHMAAQNYPAIEQHKAKHAEFRNTLTELVREFEEDGATHRLGESVNTFQIAWLKNHIQQIDKQFGAFLKEKGVALHPEH
ncbi:MAG TPA: bacteriohemerythrin [Candidatus Bathyarchaeia archaeon]|nr:bacteriohemerythrin [Candidatus Bathyarchaeia archaeon]